MKKDTDTILQLDTDVIIIGGGVMGLLSAYRLRKRNKRVIIIDSGTIGGPQAASSGITRSIRNDYKDPLMAKMANDAYKGWEELQTEWQTKLFEPSGVLNIVHTDLTDLAVKDTYAAQSKDWLTRDSRIFKEFGDKTNLQKAYPQLEAEYGVIDIDAGMAFPRVVVGKLLESFKADPDVRILEKTHVNSIKATLSGAAVGIGDTLLIAHKVVIAAGRGSTDVAKKVDEGQFKIPIKPDRPFELKYYFTDDARFRSDKLPVLAFLDVGIYVHPVVSGLTDAVKIGYYYPPGVDFKFKNTLKFIDTFVSVCLPELKNSRNEIVTDVDQCSYDMTPDNKFIVGYLGGSNNIVVATGFNGTGFKFAPTISSVVELLVQEEPIAYDIAAYDPNRFSKGGR